MRLIGLTGGIASGKSAVARLLRGAGVPVVDADVLAREAVAKGTEGLAHVVARFGEEMLLDDGDLDRKKLGVVVFHDEAARRDLNAIVHPRVAQLAVATLATLRDAGEQVAVYEVPLLFESGLQRMMDATLLVAAPVDVQRARLRARDGMGNEDADARIAAQMSLDEKRKRATAVVDNAGTLAELALSLRPAWLAVSGMDVAFGAANVHRIEKSGPQ